MIANSAENENGELEQWLTTGNEYYDVDPEGNDIFEYNVHDVQFKDGKIVRINVYSREKEQDSKEFSYQALVLQTLKSKEKGKFTLILMIDPEVTKDNKTKNIKEATIQFTFFDYKEYKEKKD